jgi:hypothetical protein
LNATPPAGQSSIDFLITPDSGRVVWLAEQDQSNVLELYSAPIAGGPNRKLNPPLVAGGDVSLARVGSDSAHAVYLADQDFDGVEELFRVGTAGTPSSKAVSLSLTGGGQVSSFLLSPSGDRLVYLADQDQDETFEIYLGFLDRGLVFQGRGPFAPAPQKEQR